MRRIIPKVFLLLVFASFVHASTDDLEDLIDKERVVNQPQSVDDAPPPAILLGDAGSVTIYSSVVYGGNPSPLCEAIPFDELMDLSDGNLRGNETVLNMKSPRIRDALEKACLIRPGDDVFVVGRGIQSWVKLGEFFVRPGRTHCQEDSPYALFGRLEQKLASEPLFYATHADLKEGDNYFQPLHMKPGTSPLIKQLVPDVAEYSVAQATVSASNVEIFFFLKRRMLRPEEDGFPSEIVLWQKGDRVNFLTQEQVDSVDGSGHLRIEGVLDFNQDGYLDVWLEGDQKKCPYYLLYQGLEDGFAPVELPNPPCSC